MNSSAFSVIIEANNLILMNKSKMHNLKVSLIALAVMPSICLADGSFLRDQKEREELTLEERKEKIMSCGHYDEVGPSSIFGMPSDYQSKYPEIGYLSAEIDRVAKVDPKIRKSVQVIFRDAKDKWDRLDYSLDKNRKMLKRNETEVNTTAQIADNTMRIFRNSQDELEKEQRFVLTKAQKEATSLMKSDRRKIGREDYTTSSWDQLEICREWWLYEQRSIPQWQKNNPGFQSLNKLSGENHGYNVESQFGDGRSSNKNASRDASGRLSERSRNYSNSGLEHFQYQYDTNAGSSNSGNQSRQSQSRGGLEMQW